MINTDKLPVIVDQKAINSLNQEIEDKEETLSRYRQAMKGLEDFLTFIYNNSRTFRDLKEKFNERSDFCRIRMKDNKVKVEVYEDN